MTWFFSLSLLLQIGILYLLAINVMAFFYIGVDKLRAQVQKRRVPETLLWFLTILGGTIGMLSGMHFFRHKTKKISFQLVVTVICIFQMLLLYISFFR